MPLLACIVVVVIVGNYAPSKLLSAGVYSPSLATGVTLIDFHQEDAAEEIRHDIIFIFGISLIISEVFCGHPRSRKAE